MASIREKTARSVLSTPLFSSSAVVLLFALGCSSSDTGTGTNPGAINNGDASSSSGSEPKIPEAPASCPELKTGTVQFQGKDVQLWVGQKQTDKKGSVLFYWHGTSSVSAEATVFMQDQINEITSEGGIVASFTTTVGTGTNTGNFVWYTDDFISADQILACAIQQLNIDTHRIYSAGCSAGGLQAGAMAVVRSSYIAAVMPNSGGSLLSDWEDPSHIPAIITAHGSCADHVILYFNNVSHTTDRVFAKMGGVAVDCDHGGGHCGAPKELITAQWQFLKDHPFGVNPDPYAGGLPASFPTYCQQYPVEGDAGVCP